MRGFLWLFSAARDRGRFQTAASPRDKCLAFPEKVPGLFPGRGTGFPVKRKGWRALRPSFMGLVHDFGFQHFGVSFPFRLLVDFSPFEGEDDAVYAVKDKR